MIKLAISGCQGKMGQRIAKLAETNNEFKIVTLLERKGHSAIGTKIDSVEISDNLDKIKDADVLIEFTTPQATIEHLDACVKYKKSMVIGTTGLTPEQKEKITDASKKIPIVFSPNMSIGVNLLQEHRPEYYETMKQCMDSLDINYPACFFGPYSEREN